MEKRRHKRLDLKIPVTIRCNGTLIPATVLNVSCGGMCIQTETSSISKDDLVEVSFDLDKSKKDLSLRGAVARKTDDPVPCVSVQFGNFYSESHKTLREYLHTRIY